jgi:cobalt-zinc-cadmium efflux system outer membrane protein
VRASVVALAGVGFAFAAWADVVPAPEPPRLPAKLTLNDSLKLLHERGLDLLIAEAAVSSAEGDYRIAGAVPNPGLSLAYGNSFYQTCTPNPATGLTCPAPTPPPSLTAGLSDSNAIEDFLSGKRGLRKDVASAALESAKLSRADAERNLVFQVKAQFAQVLLAVGSLAFAKEVADASVTLLEKTELKKTAGAISNADVLRMKVAKLESDQAVDQAAQNVRTAKAGLAFLLGARGSVPEFEVEQPELTQFSIPSKLKDASRDALLSDAFKSRPDLLAQRAQAQRAESSVALARRSRFPDIALNLGYTQQGTDPTAITPPTFSVGLSAPLPIFYQQQGEVLKAEADLRTQQLQAAKLEAQVVNDLETAYATYVATQSLVQRMESGTLLDSAKKALDAVSAQREFGAASMLDYLAARQTFIATRVEYLNDLTNYWTAVFGLEKATGEELR